MADTPSNLYGKISNLLHGFTRRSKGKEVFDAIAFKSMYVGATDSLTAHAGGGQASATQLNHGFNRIATCATLNDSAQLPSAVGGMVVIVANDGAAAAKIYGKNGLTDTIDGTAGATGVTLTNAKRVIFIAIADGKWISFGTGESA